jgi:hypothetical protein
MDGIRKEFYLKTSKYPCFYKKTPLLVKNLKNKGLPLALI